MKEIRTLAKEFIGALDGYALQRMTSRQLLLLSNLAHEVDGDLGEAVDIERRRKEADESRMIREGRS